MQICVYCPNKMLILLCFLLKPRGSSNFISKEESKRHEGMFSLSSRQTTPKDLYFQTSNIFARTSSNFFFFLNLSVI